MKHCYMHTGLLITSAFSIVTVTSAVSFMSQGIMKTDAYV